MGTCVNMFAQNIDCGYIVRTTSATVVVDVLTAKKIQFSVFLTELILHKIAVTENYGFHYGK